MNKPKKIEWVEVPNERNLQLGIELNCHMCTSHRPNPGGYPKSRREGFHVLHRWMHWKNTGETPEVVMHLCDNRKCINPKHLKSGTQSENMRDMVSKGRNRNGGSGEKHPLHKLTSEDVKWIRTWISLGHTQKSIAKPFGVAKSTVSKIKLGKAWKEI